MREAIVLVLAACGALVTAVVVIGAVALAAAAHGPNARAMTACAHEIRDARQLNGAHFERCYAAHGGTGTLTHYSITRVRVTHSL